MKIGVVADDFTGASDLANTLARAGARTTLYLGLPADLDRRRGRGRRRRAQVAVHSRRPRPSRSRWRRSTGSAPRAAEQILFKYCSTFDSTPRGQHRAGRRGAGSTLLGAELVVVCPAFPDAGRTIYQGHLFVGDRLLSESGMERHPLTPMTDPDLRRWLARQTRREGRPRPARRRCAAAAAIATALVGERPRGAAADRRRRHRGRRPPRPRRGRRRPRPRHRRLGDRARPARELPASRAGAARAAGPRPRATRARPRRLAARRPPARQIAASPAAPSVAEARDRRRPARSPDAEAERGRSPAPLDHRGSAPLVYSLRRSRRRCARLQAAYGREASAQRFREPSSPRVAAGAADAGFRRIIVAGGETSGAVVTGLASAALGIGPEIDTGVPAMRRPAEPPLAVALKSGNFGGPDFFATRAAALPESGVSPRPPCARGSAAGAARSSSAA